MPAFKSRIDTRGEAFARNREQIVARIRAILEATLGDL